MKPHKKIKPTDGCFEITEHGYFEMVKNKYIFAINISTK